MLLPQIGEAPLGTHSSRKARVSASASAVSMRLSRTRWVRPDWPWVRVFHSSMPARISSLWWMAITGPSARTLSWLSVTMVAISMMWSLSGSRPVISRSIQIRLCGFCMAGLLGWGGSPGSVRRVSRVKARQTRAAPAKRRRGGGVYRLPPGIPSRIPNATGSFVQNPDPAAANSPLPGDALPEQVVAPRAGESRCGIRPARPKMRFPTRARPQHVQTPTLPPAKLAHRQDPGRARRPRCAARGTHARRAGRGRPGAGAAWPGDCPLRRAGGCRGRRRRRQPLPSARQPAHPGHRRPRCLARRRPGPGGDRRPTAAHQRAAPRGRSRPAQAAARQRGPARHRLRAAAAAAREPIDRYAVAAEHAGIRALLLLNEADLLDAEHSPFIDGWLGTYRQLGY